MTKVEFQLKHAGYCTASWHHAEKGAPKKSIRFYATFGVIKHPEHGVVLFDTGYSSRFFESTSTYPYKLYRKFTPVYLKNEEEAKMQLAAGGIQPNEVAYIIVSHFHADHIGGLKDFPQAKFICSTSAYDDIKGKSGFNALKKGFLPAQLPPDFAERTKFIDVADGGSSDPHLGKLYDLFRDGSLLLCQLDGHAKGQLGALLTTNKGKVFLISDAAWLRSNYKEMKLPHPLVRLFFSSWTDFKRSLQKVNHYHRHNPSTLIVPCHCHDTLVEINGL